MRVEISDERGCEVARLRVKGRTAELEVSLVVSEFEGSRLVRTRVIELPLFIAKWVLKEVKATGIDVSQNAKGAEERGQE